MKEIIKKWYHRLPFPEAYREPFYHLLETSNLEPISFADYKEEDYTKPENLLLFLYFCEELYGKYQEKGIDDAIFYDTIEDIVRWTVTYYKLYGHLGFEMAYWLKNHMSFTLFHLGRLQFNMAPEGLEVHIAAGKPLDIEACEASFRASKPFFEKYFPEYQYDRLTCYSWLLDSNLRTWLKEDSNILRFQKFFTVEYLKEEDAALRYTFPWNTTRDNIPPTPTTGLYAKLREHVLAGGKLYCGFGTRPK